MIKNILLLFIMLQIVSCASPPIKIDPLKNYMLDILISNRPSGDQYVATGMIVLPRKPLYTIEFEADSRINYISFKTCSRETTAFDPSVGFSHRKYSINYAPNEIEQDGKCSTMISAFNDENMLSVGFISYENPAYSLPAVNICGSKTLASNGSSVCQGRVDSIQKIKFEQDVIANSYEGCEFPIGPQKEFIYKVSKSYCLFTFMTLDGKLLHKLNTYGYDAIQVRL